MGLFISMSGVVGGCEDSVADALRTYALGHKGKLEKAKLTTEDDGCLVISEGAGGVTVLYPGDFFDWDDASQYLSKRLQQPVFSFHIHDGDLWMYTLYENGEAVDWFNPVPDYWQELDDEERQPWQGNASAISRLVLSLTSEQIANYLVHWDDDVFEGTGRKKAYPTDQFYYGDDWQLIDFMKKLGFDYPINDRGAPRGVTFQFKCEPDTGARINASIVSPSGSELDELRRNDPPGVRPGNGECP